MNEPRRFAVIIEEGKDNYSAYSPDLPGCVTTGSTIEQTIENMKEAISFHLDGLREDSQPLPQTATVGTMIVTVPA